MTYDDRTRLDAIIARLQTMQPFPIQAIDISGNVHPWLIVDGHAIVPDLVINPHTLREQVDTVAGSIIHWGRMAAQCQRVWEVREREYRGWRSPIELECHRHGIPGVDKITEKLIEVYYRTLPEYNEFQQRVEEAHEAFNAATAVLEAFKAKKDMLRSDIYRSRDGSLQRGSI